MEHDKKESRLPSELKNDDLVSYSEAISSAQPKPYIAAVIFPITKNTSLFTLGDVANTVVTRRRRSDGRKHQNGPLKPGTSYKIFQRVFVDDQVSSEINLCQILRAMLSALFLIHYKYLLRFRFLFILLTGVLQQKH